MAGGYHIGQLRLTPIWQPRTLGDMTLKCQAQEESWEPLWPQLCFVTDALKNQGYLNAPDLEDFLHIVSKIVYFRGGKAG